MRFLLGVMLVGVVGCGVSSNAYDASGPALGQDCAGAMHAVCSPDAGEIWCCDATKGAVSVCATCGAKACKVVQKDVDLQCG